MSATFTYAIKNDEYIPISEFSPNTGFRCGCKCPECGHRVGSRIFIDETDRSCYFHEWESDDFVGEIDPELRDCTGGHKETELHLLSKEIIAKNKSIEFPRMDGSRFTLNYNHVRIENKLGRIRPDIIIKDQDEKDFIIEIAVTHFIKDEEDKLEKIKNLGIPTIEIDLSDYKNYDLSHEVNKFKVEEIVIQNTNNKKWIYPHKKESLIHYNNLIEVESKGIGNGNGCFLFGLLGMISLWFYMIWKKK